MQQQRQQHQEQQRQQQQQQHSHHQQQQRSHQQHLQHQQHQHQHARGGEPDLDVDVQAFALNLNQLTGFTEDDETHIGMDDVMAMATGGHSHAHDKQAYMAYAPFGVGGGGGYGGPSAAGVPAGSRLFGGGAGLAGGMGGGLGTDMAGIGGLGAGGGMGMNGGGGAAGSRLFERWSAPNAGMPFSQGSDSEENFTEASLASTASGTRTPLNLELDDVPGSPEIYSESMANACALSALDFRQTQQSRLLAQAGLQQQRGQPGSKQVHKKPGPPGYPQYQTTH